MRRKKPKVLKVFLAVLESAQNNSADSGKPASRFQSLDRELKVHRTFAHFRSEAAHAQEEPKVRKVSWQFGIGPK